MEAAAGSKTCPECAEEVKAAARVCRFCGHRFDGQAAEATAARGPAPVVGRNVELEGAFLNGSKWDVGRWLILMDDGLAISGEGEASFAARWEQIEAINIDGPDTVQSRVTVPRVLLLGLFALAARKNESRTYVSIETTDHRVGLFGVRATLPEVRATLASYIPVLAHHQAARA